MSAPAPPPEGAAEALRDPPHEFRARARARAPDVEVQILAVGQTADLGARR